jgi:hypothetical protein
MTRIRAESLMTFGAVAALVAAASAAYAGASSLLVVGIGTVGLGWVGVRAGVELGRSDVPTPSRRQVRAVALSLALVGALVAGPGAGTAMAQTDGDQTCTAVDSLIYHWFSGEDITESVTGNDFYGNPDNPCSTAYKINQTIEDMKASDANQTKADIQAAAASQVASTEPFDATYQNQLNNSRTAAWLRAEQAIAEAYNNGENASVARQNAKDAIDSYYTIRQKNLIASWESQVAAWQSLDQIAANESLDSHYTTINQSSGTQPGQTNNDGISFGTYNVTLADGNTSETTYVKANLYDDPTSGSAYAAVDGSDAGQGGIGMYDRTSGLVVASEDSANTTEVLTFADYGDPWSEIETKRSNLKGEVDPFVNNTYDALDNGTINESDLLSRPNKMFQYGTEYNNGSTNLYNTVGALSGLGIAAPELNGTGTMTVTYTNASGANVSADGFLMADAAPNGTWEANTTYNASAISGPVYFARTDGTTVELSGEFTIEEIRNRDGDPIGNVTAGKSVSTAADVSNLIDEIERFIEQRKQIEAREPGLIGGGSGAGSGSIPPVAIAAVLGGAIVLLISRS